MEAITLDATGTKDIGDGSDAIISTFVIQIVGTGFTGTIEIQGKAYNAPDLAYTPITYRDRSDDTTGTGALTGDALIEVNASGLRLRLDVTVAAGSVTMYVVPVLG